MQFNKIPLNQFKIDFEPFLCESSINTHYENLTLPKRATIGSAGYDFYAPIDIHIEPGETFKFPTGVNIELDSGCVLLLMPRSSLGFKYKLQLDNTIGVIDSDYINSDNYGHMWAKFTNWGDKPVDIKCGERYMQGIIVRYELVDNDNSSGKRNGGFGSTNITG